MALQVDLAGSCQSMLAYLGDLAKGNYPFLLGRKTGVLDFLLNPVNGSIKMDLNNTQQGRKYIETRVHYKIRTKPSEILTNSSVGDVCDTASEPAELSTTVEITKRVGTSPKKFTNDKMINICQNTQAFVNEYVASDMKALREKVAEVLLNAMEGGSGRNYRHNGEEKTAVQTTDVQLLGTTSTTGVQAPLYANFADILLDYQNNQLTGYPHLIGNGNLAKFYTLSNFSAANSTAVSYEAAIASGAAFYQDWAANSILGTNEFLMVAPNVAHLLWFNRNTNININTPIVQHIVIPDPVYPQLKWDFDFKWDECDKAWIYTLAADYDLFTLPSDTSGSDDLASPVVANDLVGMTGIFRYKATAA